MSYKLIIGDYAYSSWSLRGWLLLRRFGIPCDVELLDFHDDRSVAEQLAAHSPARTVPTLITSDGAIISESLAIAEELAIRHPDAGLWPGDPTARATARGLAAEMATGFAALRNYCPMNLRTAYKDVPVPEAVRADLDRLELIWGYARKTCAADGPWLCGDYSAADAFFAPVAARIAGYGLSVSEPAQAYVDAHLSDLAFRRWRAMGLVRGATLPWYAKDFATRDWPGPAVLPCRTVADGPSVNSRCPYSGDPVTDYLEFDGRIWGFCNPFCRDKTQPDPEAWPAFMEMVRSM